VKHTVLPLIGGAKTLCWLIS